MKKLRFISNNNERLWQVIRFYMLFENSTSKSFNHIVVATTVRVFCKYRGTSFNLERDDLVFSLCGVCFDLVHSNF